MGSAVVVDGAAEQLGGKRKEDDGEQPQHRGPHQGWVVAGHRLEPTVLHPPEAGDHHEAQREREEAGGVAAEEVGDARVDVPGRLDQRQDQQRDGDGDDRVGEPHQPLQAALCLHGPMVPCHHIAPRACRANGAGPCSAASA
jgi:hypothetical protein